MSDAPEDHRYAALPPIASVRDQDGPWGSAGQTGTIVLSDGGTKITWSRTVLPRGPAERVAMPVFAGMWHGYARRALARLEQPVVPR